jgi:hypothetical protein
METSPSPLPDERRSLGVVVWTSAALASLVATLDLIGSDALWLVPLGGQIVHGQLPSSIPYASAPSHGWHDVPAGGQVVFWALFHAFGGERGLMVGQAVAAAVGFGALAHGIRRQASGSVALLVAVLVLVGSFPAVAVTNVALFSLALFPVLLILLEREAGTPTRRIWLSVPLLALWGNLHGGVLVGWALLACYLVLERARRRPRESAALLVAAALALFANPELWDTPHYYWSVFRNEAAKQGVGLWTPLTASGFNVFLVVVAVVLAGLALRARTFRLWEAVAVAGLAVATVEVARNGVWLLFVVAYPAARSLRLGEPRRSILVLAAALLTMAAVAVGLVRGPIDPGSRSLARLAARGGQTVLAEPILGQQVVLDGGRIWVNNPLDAFRPADQRLYLDWSSGKRSGADAISHAQLVLVRSGSAAGRFAAADRRLVLVLQRDGAVLYRVRPRD